MKRGYPRWGRHSGGGEPEGEAPRSVHEGSILVGTEIADRDGFVEFLNEEKT